MSVHLQAAQVRHGVSMHAGPHAGPHDFTTTYIHHCVQSAYIAHYHSWQMFACCPLLAMMIETQIIVRLAAAMMNELLLT